MSDIKLFHYGNSTVTELKTQSAPVEKWLQHLIESNMDAFLGIRFLATEFSTSKSHRGRIDSLGIDENNCPVIIEYKRHTNENVINQGLFYLDWLMEHKADFQLLVMQQRGSPAAECIDWTGPRLLCIAGDFTKYDEYAVQQINRNIELIRYRMFAEDHLMLELVNSAEESQAAKTIANGSRQEGHKYNLTRASKELVALYEALREYLLGLGEEVQEKELKLYAAFKRIKNFACVQVNSGKSDPCLVMWLKIDPASMEMQDGFIRDVTNIGHFGTGNLEVRIRTMDDLQRAKQLIEQSYQNS